METYCDYWNNDVDGDWLQRRVAFTKIECDGTQCTLCIKLNDWLDSNPPGIVKLE